MNLAFNASRMIGAKVLIIGDIMLDQYQRGVVERISPEAPVPIVKVTDQEFKIGGAGNVAQNIAMLGGKATLISVCGQDLYGQNLARICADLGVDARLLMSTARETTLKTRIMAAHQQMLRVDLETATPFDDAEFRDLTEAVDACLPEFDVVVLSDYGKGVISPEFLKWFGPRIKAGQKVVLDPKTCNFPFYSGLYCMTPNTKEASEGAEMPVKNKNDIIEVGIKILRERALQTLVITLGSDGMAVFLPGHGIFHLPTMARDVFDVTGAGDTVIGVVSLGLSAGLDLLTSCMIANCAAGVVVGQVGAVGITQEDLTEALGVGAMVHHEKWADL